MQGPEGRPLNVSPARKGWGLNHKDDPSAVGAALDLNPLALCHEANREICSFQIRTETQVSPLGTL